MAHGTPLNITWQPGWERGLGKSGCMYMMYVYGWVAFASLWNYRHMVCVLAILSYRGLPGGSQWSACNTEDTDSTPGLGRSPGGENGNPLQYYCLENSMDGGVWWATVHGVARSRTWLKWLSMHAHRQGGSSAQRDPPFPSLRVRAAGEPSEIHFRSTSPPYPPYIYIYIFFFFFFFLIFILFWGKRKWGVSHFGHVRLLATPWTVAHQTPPSMEFSKQ